MNDITDYSDAGYEAAMRSADERENGYYEELGAAHRARGWHWTTRSRFVVHVAGATADGRPFKHGYSRYVVTLGSWRRRERHISREHGGNMCTRWYYRGVPVLYRDIEVLIGG